jgi:GT2 family glycosyltransferase
MGQLDKDLNFVKEANQVLDGKSYMSGWCLASTRKIWNTLMIQRPPPPFMSSMDWDRNNDEYCQLFSEEFGLAYFEDTDLSFRARKQGIKFEVVDIPVVHFGKQTSAQLNTYQLYKQARQVFIKKWANK